MPYREVGEAPYRLGISPHGLTAHRESPLQQDHEQAKTTQNALASPPSPIRRG